MDTTPPEIPTVDSVKHHTDVAVEALRQRVDGLREAGAAFVREEPLKAVLVAAAAGAAVALLARALIGRDTDRG